MHKPVLIYLDSSDYSLLSDPQHAADSEVQQVKRYLTDSVRDGTVEVRYSAIHIVEACHRGPSSYELAKLRAELIRELSGFRVMKFFRGVCADEIAAAQLSEVVTGRVGTDDDGKWHPDVPGLGKDIRDAILGAMKDAIVSVPRTRSERRRAKALFGTPGAPKPAALQALATNPELIDSLAAKHGMSPRFVRDRVMTRVLRNESVDSIDREVRHELFDPVSFISHYVDRLDRDDRIRTSVVSLGQRLGEAMGQIIEATRVLSKSPDFRAMAPVIAKEWQAGAVDRKKQLRAKIGEALFRPDTNGRDLYQETSDIPCRGLDVFTEAVELWLSDTAAQVTNPRNPKVSDSGDLLHLFYLPYVDLWRGDGWSCGIASRIRASQCGIVVRDLRNIPAEVTRHMKTQHTE
jgi:hypothetical protein